jgi:phosphatidylglycerol:prolipoprotein diacylglycerol transferase
MLSTLFEIETLSPAHGLIIAGVLSLAAVLWTLYEARAGRLEREELRTAILWSVGTAAVASAILYIASRYVHPIQIRSYGVMLMLAFAAGIYVAMQRAPLYRIDPPHIIDLSLFVLVGSLIGARVCYVLLNWGDEFASEAPREVLSVWEGGLSFHGGLIGGVLAGLLFCYWRRVRPSLVADLVAPSVALGYAIARLGCFLNGCCHGGPTNLPWGVDFPEAADDVQVHIHVHPTQLYASLGSVLVAILLLWLVPRIRVPGHLAMWYLACGSVLRFFVEFLRRGYTADPWRPLSALTEAQAASLGLIIVSLIVIVATRGRVGYPLPREDQPEESGEGAGRSKDKDRKQRRRSRKKRR